MPRILYALLLALALVAPASAQPSGQTTTVDLLFSTDQLAAAPGHISPKVNAGRVADAAFIQQRLASNGLALLDIRPDPEDLGTDGGMRGMHASGHIAGAQQVPWNTLVGQDGRFLSRDQLDAKFRAAGATVGKPVVTYCMVGMRASVAYFVARYLGYDARLYEGSIIDWTQRKLPTETGR